ncbi:MAG: hypothetical protein ABIP94_21910, partial [Planctomycetota bacterium]
TCTSLPVSTSHNENVSLRISGDMNAPFLLFASGTTMPCLSIPGVGNGLVLGLPADLVAVGILTQVTPCLSCPPGYEAFNFTVPTSLPSGMVISFQAASFGNGQLALTTAITVTVL